MKYYPLRNLELLIEKSDSLKKKHRTKLLEKLEN